MNKHTIHILTFMFLWCCGAGASATELYFVHSDHLNTPQVITDFNQQVVWEGKRLPFGETDVTSTQIEFNLRFPGQYYDLETGLHYNYYRDYDPSLGRYVQSDPIGLRGGLNTYGYAYQNPLSFIDPTGQVAIVDDAVVTAVVLTTAVVAACTATHCVDKAVDALSDAASAAADALSKMCQDDKPECDMKLIRKMPSYDGKTFTCVYTSKGSTFTFPQAVGYECPSIDMERCLVNTNEIMPPARY